MKRSLISAFVGLLSAVTLAAQQQPAPTPADHASSSTIRSNVQEVVLDMVFRDKKGKPIRDIRPEEVHVFEQGADQKLTSFRLVEGKTTRPLGGGSATAAALPLDPMREVRLVTLVFEGLDVDGKRFFRQAVKDLLDMAPEQNLYFSVFTIDQKLHCLQPFTQDHAQLMKTLEKSAMWSYIQYSNQSAEVKSELKQAISGGAPTLQSGGQGPPSAAQIQDSVNYTMSKLQYDMLQEADAADREYSARATLDALESLVQGEAEMPGRKVVLYFNPWFNVPEMVKEQYKDLVSRANRANVSFYTVDTKGLVTWSQGSAGRDLLGDATREVRQQQLSGGVGEVSPSQVRAQENAESAIRSNPLLWLRDLAGQTGGESIAETNDWKAPLRSVMDEVQTYYEASYAPQIATYDGKFRQISVKVDRPNVFVHTRSGYFALPPIKGGQQLFAYEMPLLNVLNATPARADLDFHAAAERFNDRGPKVEYMVTMEAPLKELTFTPEADKKNAKIDAALLAVLKDTNGGIVDKFSKDFAVQVAADKVDAYKAGGNLVQTFRTELTPGQYTLEAVIMDRNSNKVAVKKTAVVVPQPSDKLSISDIVVVRRMDELKNNQILDAFYFPGGKVVPTLVETLKGGPGNVLPFYFSVYPDHSVQDPPKLTMAFFKEGQYLGSAQAPLPQAQDGRIPYIANLPADKFTPGAYEIRVDITQGALKAEEKVDFRVE